MRRPTPGDRQHVIDLTHAILRREGWRVHVNPRRVVRPCVWVEEAAGDASAALWVTARIPRVTGKAWRCTLADVRTHDDGTGRGWHRRAAERIAATVRGWA